MTTAAHMKEVLRMFTESKVKWNDRLANRIYGVLTARDEAIEKLDEAKRVGVSVANIIRELERDE